MRPFRIRDRTTVKALPARVERLSFCQTHRPKPRMAQSHPVEKKWARPEARLRRGGSGKDAATPRDAGFSGARSVIRQAIKPARSTSRGPRRVTKPHPPGFPHTAVRCNCARACGWGDFSRSSTPGDNPRQARGAFRAPRAQERAARAARTPPPRSRTPPWTFQRPR